MRFFVAQFEAATPVGTKETVTKLCRPEDSLSDLFRWYGTQYPGCSKTAMVVTEPHMEDRKE